MKENFLNEVMYIILWSMCNSMYAMPQNISMSSNLVSSAHYDASRSVSGTTDDQTPANQITFGPTNFSQTNKFFLGASDVGSGEPTKALSRVDLIFNNDTGQWGIVFNPLAPAGTCVVNGTPNLDSPFKGKNITTLASTPAGLPLGVIEDAPTKIHLVTDAFAGQVVLQTVDDINDANNDATSGVVSAAASNNYIIAAVGPNGGTFGSQYSGFASIKINTAGFSLNNQRWDGTTSVDTAAYQLKVDGGYDQADAGIVSMAKTTALQFPPSTCDMYYDAQLDRWYIALSDTSDEENQATKDPTGIRAGNEKATDRAAALLIANMIDIGGGNKRLEIRTALNPDRTDTQGFANVSDGATNKIVVATKGNFIGLYKVRVMHTSTGKNYVIVNGSDSTQHYGCEAIQNDDTDRNYRHAGVYAIPVMPKGSKAANKKDISGVIADATVTADKKFQVIQSNAGLPNAQAEANKVGANYKYLYHKINDNVIVVINDVQVIGDSVYVSLAGNRGAAGTDDSGEAGIFSSTAIFDEYGTIRSWTPWQRVMGFPDKTEGFGLDINTQNYWYLQGQDNKTVKATQWNRGDSAATGIHGGKPLSDVLNTKKIVNAGGVLGLFTFDADTPGFKPYSVAQQQYPQFSMMVATGYGWVALIETGRLAARGTENVYETTKEFTASDFVSVTAPVYRFDASSSVQVIKDRSSELANLGNIVCAEVARSSASVDNANKGWVFVGGDNGIAVLRSDYNGKGWPNNKDEGLNQLLCSGYPVVDGSYNFAWKQIAKRSDGRTPLGITNVRKLTSDGTYLYIVTRDALYRLFMDTETFKNGKLLYDAYLQEIVTITSAMDATGTAHLFRQYFDEFFDAMIVDDSFGAHRVVLATSKGLFINVDPIINQTSTQNNKWQPVKKADGTTDFSAAGPVLKIDFINSKAGGAFVNNKLEGNMYALALDSTIKKVNVYRFNVSNGIVKAFAEPYRSDDGTGIAVYTDYFYSMGTLNEWLRSQLAFQGPLDLVATAEDYGNNDNDFVSAIPMIPNPQGFLNAGNAKSEINFDLDVVSFSQLRQCIKQPIDPAAGAQYIPGQYGVLVNE